MSEIIESSWEECHAPDTSYKNAIIYYNEDGFLIKKERSDIGWDIWDKKEKFLSWDEVKEVLSKYTKSKHVHNKGDKQIPLKLELICCVDNDGGNFNDDTGYWFEGNNGFFFKDVDENIYSTNGRGFYNGDKDYNCEMCDNMPSIDVWEEVGDNKPYMYDMVFPYQEGMVFSFIANIADNEKTHLEDEECKHTRLTHIKNVKLLNPNEKNISFTKDLQSVDDYFKSKPHMSEEEIEINLRESKQIERGPNGEKVKQHFEDKCQICKAQNKRNSSFVKENGRLYSEAHHVIQLSDGGPDTTENIMCLCSDHHAQMHHGNVKVEINKKYFHVTIDGEKRVHTIPRWRT